MYYSSFHLKTNYGCNDYDFTDQLFPTSIVESPTGQQYTITYEPTPGYPGDVTSRVQQITFPSGGFIKYTYSGGTNGFDCSTSNGVIPTLTKTVGDGNGNTSAWTYVSGYNSSHISPFNVTATDPAGNDTFYTFAGEFQLASQIYQGAVSPSNLVSSTVTCYNGHFSNCSSVISALQINETSVIQQDVFTYPGGSSSASVQETKYNTAGAVTEVRQYDWGVATSYPPTSATHRNAAQRYSDCLFR